MKLPPNMLSAAQVEAFDLYIRVWQERLGLNDWRIERGRRKASKAMADVVISHPDRLATYRLGDFGAAIVSDESLESTAVHELLHVLLCELVHQSAYGIEGAALTSAEHRVVNVLEKLLLKGD